MNTVISVMDREYWGARTDVIVFVDCANKQLLWVPRDLWCAPFNGRINEVFRQNRHTFIAKALYKFIVPCRPAINRALKRTSHKNFLKALLQYGLSARQSICLLPSAIERGINTLSVQVPVSEPMTFRYPLKRDRPIEHGERQITFSPPYEKLSGERIHQWIGARFGVNGDNSDLKRIERQKILIKRMLEEKFDFKRFAGEGVSFTAGFDFKELEHINADWEFKTLNDGKFTRTFMGKKDVLVP